MSSSESRQCPRAGKGISLPSELAEGAELNPFIPHRVAPGRVPCPGRAAGEGFLEEVTFKKDPKYGGTPPGTSR